MEIFHTNERWSLIPQFSKCLRLMIACWGAELMIKCSAMSTFTVWEPFSCCWRQEGSLKGPIIHPWLLKSHTCSLTFPECKIKGWASCLKNPSLERFFFLWKALPGNGERSEIILSCGFPLVLTRNLSWNNSFSVQYSTCSTGDCHGLMLPNTALSFCGK